MRSITADKFCEKAREEKLCSNNEYQYPKEKSRPVRNTDDILHILQYTEVCQDAETCQKKQNPKCSKEMHWSFSKLADKHNRHDVEKTIHHPFPTKFCFSKFAGLMLHNLFSYS